MQSLSTAQARRIALAAQGFLDKRHAVPTMRTFQRTLDRTGVLQVDSVNVLQRAHYMPLYSRMGPYDTDDAARAPPRRQPRRIVEYWAHVQAFMPVDLWPVMQHRMADHRAERGKWGIVEEDPALEKSLIDEVRDLGPSTARHLDDGLPRAKENWGWNWSEHPPGPRLPLHRRRPGDRRPQQPVRGALRPARSGCIPAEILARETPVARRRQPRAGPPGRPLARRRHRPVPARLLPDAHQARRPGDRGAGRGRRAGAGHDRRLEPPGVPPPRRPPCRGASTRAPCSARSTPWCGSASAPSGSSTSTTGSRSTPRRHKRVHGYYVLPFLLGDRIVARVDLKADRASRPARREGGVRRARRTRRDRRGARRRAPRPRRLAGPVRRSRSSRGATWRRRSVPDRPLRRSTGREWGSPPPAG